MHSIQPGYLIPLLFLHLLVSLEYFALLGKALSHLDDLLHVLILEVYDFREGFLVHLNHLHVSCHVLMLPIVVLVLGKRNRMLLLLLKRRMRRKIAIANGAALLLLEVRRKHHATSWL